MCNCQVCFALLEYAYAISTISNQPKSKKIDQDFISKNRGSQCNQSKVGCLKFRFYPFIIRNWDYSVWFGATMKFESFWRITQYGHFWPLRLHGKKCILWTIFLGPDFSGNVSDKIICLFWEFQKNLMSRNYFEKFWIPEKCTFWPRFGPRDFSQKFGFIILSHLLRANLMQKKQKKVVYRLCMISFKKATTSFLPMSLSFFIYSVFIMEYSFPKRWWSLWNALSSSIAFACVVPWFRSFLSLLLFFLSSPIIDFITSVTGVWQGPNAFLSWCTPHLPYMVGSIVRGPFACHHNPSFYLLSFFHRAAIRYRSSWILRSYLHRREDADRPVISNPRMLCDLRLSNLFV